MHTTLAAAGAAAGLGILIIVILAIGVYFIPSIVAFSRHHHQAGAVFAINLLLGWSIIGWAVALAMALSAHRQPPVIIDQSRNFGGSPGGMGPGWYPDPGGSRHMRWWNGMAWGDLAEVPDPNSPT